MCTTPHGVSLVFFVDRSVAKKTRFAGAGIVRRIFGIFFSEDSGNTKSYTLRSFQNHCVYQRVYSRVHTAAAITGIA